MQLILKKSIFRIFDIVESNEDNIQKTVYINSARSLFNFIKFKQLYVVVRVDFNLVQIAFGYYF